MAGLFKSGEVGASVRVKKPNFYVDLRHLYEKLTGKIAKDRDISACLRPYRELMTRLSVEEIEERMTFLVTRGYSFFYAIHNLEELWEQEREREKTQPKLEPAQTVFTEQDRASLEQKWLAKMVRTPRGMVLCDYCQAIPLVVDVSPFTGKERDEWALTVACPECRSRKVVILHERFVPEDASQEARDAIWEMFGVTDDPFVEYEGAKVVIERIRAKMKEVAKECFEFPNG